MLGEKDAMKIYIVEISRYYEFIIKACFDSEEKALAYIGEQEAVSKKVEYENFQSEVTVVTLNNGVKG